MYDPSELLAMADQALDRSLPEEQLEVVLASSRETEVRAYEGAVESFVSADSSGVGIRIITDHRQGFACVGSLESDAITEAVREARDNVCYVSADPHVGLLSPDGVPPPELDLNRAALTSAKPELKIELALELEAAVRGGHPSIIGVESVDYADSFGTSVVASTEGVRSVGTEGACSIAAFSLAQRDGDTTTGFGFSVGREPSELDVSTTATSAVDRAVQMLGALSAPTERLTVVFDPWVTAQFVAIVADAFSADSVIKGRSFAAGRVGEQLAATSVTLLDDPTDPRWYGAIAADGEGMSTRVVRLLSAGVVEGYLMDGYSASVLGRQSTGSAVRSGFGSTPTPGPQAVMFAPGPLSAQEIIASVDNGLYVTEVSGLHSGVNPVSGDFSTGVEARRIRGGELAEPIREVTVASALQRMLSDIIDVGSDLTPMPMESAGQTVSIADVTMSGI